MMTKQDGRGRVIDPARDKRVKHGQERSPEYRVWVNIKQRCFNPKNQFFSHYGGRGISMCQRWVNSFDHFISDVGKRPGRGFQIERKENDGDYEPGNVLWADRFAQANNRRNNHFVEWCGRRLTISQWARELGLNKGTIWYRLNQGWPMERVLT